LLAKSDGRNNKSARDALQAPKDSVSIPNSGGTHSFSIMPDPDAIYRVRSAIVAEIEKRMPEQPDAGFDYNSGFDSMDSRNSETPCSKFS